MAVESTKLNSQSSNLLPHQLSVSKTTLNSESEVGPKVLHSVIPKEFRQVGFAEINDSDDFRNEYFLGKVAQVWPLNKRQKNGYLQKLLLSEAYEGGSGTEEKLTVFLFDEYAKSSEAIENGGFVAIAGFMVEPLTSSSSQISSSEKLLPIQILVASSPDKDAKPQIWIARKVATHKFEEKPKAIQVRWGSLLLYATYTGPTEDADEDEKDGFYGQLQDILNSVKKGDITLVLGDFNAKVGTDSNLWAGMIGPFGIGSCNGQCLLHQSPSRTYTYVFLNELEENLTDQRQLFNIFGIVQECCMRSAQANQNPSMEVILYDQTKVDFKCIIYGSKEDTFPDVHPGDIIRIHRLQIEKFRGKLKGKCFSPKSIVVFKGKGEEGIEPRTVAKSFVFTDDDKAKIKEIREWAQKANFKKLSEFHVDDFGNLVCQVIGVYIAKSSDAVLLKVWDGTKSEIDLRESDKSSMSEKIDKELFRIAKNWLVHIWIYGNYALAAGQLEPGQFVEISNAHLYYPKAKPEYAKLCIHSQEKYGRGIQVLESTDEKVKVLKCHLEKARKETEQENASFNEFTLGDSDSFLINCDISALVSTQSKKNIPEKNAEIDRHDSVLKRKLELNKENEVVDILNKKAKLADENTDLTNRTELSVLRDMSVSYTGLANITTQPLQSTNISQDEWWKSVATVSATDEHHEIKPAFLSEVLLHDAPYKFRVFVTALNFEPFFDPVQNFVRLYCPQCHYLSQNARPQLEICEMKNGIPIFGCPNCSNNSKQMIVSSAAVLEYIYLVSFLLQDGTAQLEAFLWRHHAVRFFKGIKPETILQDFSLSQLVQEMLWQICPNSRPFTSTNSSFGKGTSGTFYPILDCCVMSYTAGDVTRYQIFDTYLL